MKKHAALLLALLFALGVCAPALAYTNNVALQQGESPYKLDIYLVEYTDGDQLSSWLSMPPSDRGYAKNEIIAAIGALTVPANHSVFGDYYQNLAFKPENVSLAVMENKPYPNASHSGEIWYELNSNMRDSIPDWLDRGWFIREDGGRMQRSVFPENAEAGKTRAYGFTATAHGPGSFPFSSTEKTYRFLVFGKITGDDASLSFELRRIEAVKFAQHWQATTPWPNLKPHITLAAATPQSGLVLNEELVVYSPGRYDSGASPSHAANTYYVFENPGHSLEFHITVQSSTLPASTPGRLLFAIETGVRGKTERLYMYPNGAATGSTEYRIHVEPSTRELAFIITKYPPAGRAVNDQIKFGTAGYNSLLAFYKEWFEDKLGFSAYNEGNLLNWQDWEAIAAALIDISTTVDIQPWTPYVTVPDTIVTDPPKTGEASLYAAGGVLLMACAAGLYVMLRLRRNT